MDIDQAGATLAAALGFSAAQTEARVKVLCRGFDKDAGQTIIILECRLQPRTTPLVSPKQQETQTAKQTKAQDKPEALRQALFQSILR